MADASAEWGYSQPFRIQQPRQRDLEKQLSACPAKTIVIGENSSRAENRHLEQELGTHLALGEGLAVARYTLHRSEISGQQVNQHAERANSIRLVVPCRIRQAGQEA